MATCFSWTNVRDGHHQLICLAVKPESHAAIRPTDQNIIEVAGKIVDDIEAQKIRPMAKHRTDTCAAAGPIESPTGDEPHFCNGAYRSDEGVKHKRPISAIVCCSKNGCGNSQKQGADSDE